MENGWDLFNITTDNNNNHNHKYHNHNNNINCTRTSNDARAMWDSGTVTTPKIDWNTNNLHKSSSFFDLDNTTPASTAATTVVTCQEEEKASVHALMFDSVSSAASPFSSCLYGRGGGGGGGSHSQYCYQDPHLMCLKLGKRHYFGDAAAPLGDRHGAAAAAGGFSITKRCKPYYDAAAGLLVGPSTMTTTSAAAAAAGVTVAVTPAMVPRCQVDGCHVALLNAKDYHRRHKVCELHSKAPKVVVLGLEQRFCQQCSRFHAVEEFDESKRSCRRRLAGHNERRRKSSQDQSAPRSRIQVNGKLMTCSGRHPYYPLSSGCALSLLSSKNDSWISSADLPARCSAALSELIAENRAAILARQLILDKEWHWHHHPTEDLNSARQNGSNALANYQQLMATGSHSWDRINEAGEHVTLDLMQVPNSAFGFLSMRGKSKEDEECPELWGSYGGAHVV